MSLFVQLRRLPVLGTSQKSKNMPVSRFRGVASGSLEEQQAGTTVQTQQSELVNTKNPVVQLQNKKNVKMDFFSGLSFSPELTAISMVYFVQGIVGLARLAQQYFFKDELHLDPAELGWYTGLGALPWLIKPLYGFLSDNLPLFGYKRRSYLIICGFLGALSWLALSTLVNSTFAAVCMILLGSVGTACSDVVVDSIVVERARGEPQQVAGSLQALCWASAAVGGILSSYFSGWLVESYGTRTVFAITAFFPLAVSVSAALITEKRITAQTKSSGDFQKDATIAFEKIKHQVLGLWRAVKSSGVIYPALFTFVWQATPSAESAMFFFYTDHLHFTPEFMGRLKLAGSIASLTGIGVYNQFLKQVPLRKMFLYTALLGTALGSTQLLLVTGLNRQLGLDDQLFVLGDSVILTVLGELSFMPVLVLAARLCPEGVEATLFATLMSLLNGGSVTGGAIGAGITKILGISSDDFSNLPMLVGICVFGTLLPLPLLSLVPTAEEFKQIEKDREDQV